MTVEFVAFLVAAGAARVLWDADHLLWKRVVQDGRATRSSHVLNEHGALVHGAFLSLVVLGHASLPEEAWPPYPRAS